MANDGGGLSRRDTGTRRAMAYLQRSELRSEAVRGVPCDLAAAPRTATLRAFLNGSAELLGGEVTSGQEREVGAQIGAQGISDCGPAVKLSRMLVERCLKRCAAWGCFPQKIRAAAHPHPPILL
ncbi:hypothetical protein NDU88_008325 [Pleurodeles waltl]|uniref:Uncharacterized protein n=1 Tax=Pleurodeles waltl TaxID=8319 RepID=A0AAV7PWA7_PLEWA|nr:hypothetical protein NDU88_008325 [Pleurodeles waltl]